MRLLLPLIFHLLPLAPLCVGRGYGTVAAVLLVMLPYIKVFKLRAELSFRERQRRSPPDARLEKEIRGLEAAIRRWRALTFLPWWEQRRRAGDESPPRQPDTR